MADAVLDLVVGLVVDPGLGWPWSWSSRMLREAPATMEMAPLRTKAFRCSSAALGERKPRAWQISARVGG